jgi:hypothetical protein
MNVIMARVHGSKNGLIAFESRDLKPNIFSRKLVNLTWHGMITTMDVVLRSSFPAANKFMS